MMQVRVLSAPLLVVALLGALCWAPQVGAQVAGDCFNPSVPPTSTLSQGPSDHISTCFFGASVQLDLANSNLAWLGCPSIAAGAFPFNVNPALPLSGGGLPVLLPSIGASAFLDDVWLERSDLGWMTTSGTDAVVPFNPLTSATRNVRSGGVLRNHLPTAMTIVGSFERSNGTQISSFTTDFTSGVTRVGDRLVVATSNFAAQGLNPVNDPGTVLLFDLDESLPSEIRATFAGFLVTSDFNPTEVTALPGGLAAVSNSGVIRLTTPPMATTGGSIDIIDPGIGVILTSIPLGNAGPAYRKLAVDATGSVAVLGSAVLRQLYALDLRGTPALLDPGIDATAQRVSCNDPGPGAGGGVPCAPGRVVQGLANPIDICPWSATAQTPEGFVPEVRFGASGDFVVATAADDGLVVVLAFDPRNLSAPHPLLSSRFGPAESHQVTAAAEQGGGDRSPGPMALRPSTGGGFAGTSVLYASFTNLNRGVLGGNLGVPSGDYDTDGVEDALDVCPLVSDAPQSDVSGVGGGGPDGIGDACQCGDQTSDGAVDANDVSAIATCLAGAVACGALCDGTNDSLCDAADVTAAQLALLGAGGLGCVELSLP